MSIGPGTIFGGGYMGVPMLDKSLQCVGLESPVATWGRAKRSARISGTVVFYTDDYKFSALWKHPDAVVRSGCSAVVEVNFSTSPETPRAVVLYDIFRKRWLSRYWQEHGIRVIADLSVCTEHMDLALAGIPNGWSAFSVRAHRGMNSDIPYVFKEASRIAGGDPRLFVVFGGGQSVRDQCEDSGWVWVPERYSQEIEAVSG